MEESLGIIRSMDSTGRIVIPIELRRSLDINEGTELEIKSDGTSIIISKFQSRCCICNEELNENRDYEIYNSKSICTSCIVCLHNLFTKDDNKNKLKTRIY